MCLFFLMVLGVFRAFVWTMFEPKFKMSATVNVVCYRNKKLSKGNSPLMLRVCKDRKTKYQSLGVSVNPNDCDFQKNRPKPNCPNKDLILKIILDKVQQE